jgi:hypothetical protein
MIAWVHRVVVYLKECLIDLNQIKWSMPLSGLNRIDMHYSFNDVVLTLLILRNKLDIWSLNTGVKDPGKYQAKESKTAEHKHKVSWFVMSSFKEAMPVV